MVREIFSVTVLLEIRIATCELREIEKKSLHRTLKKKVENPQLRLLDFYNPVLVCSCMWQTNETEYLLDFPLNFFLQIFLQNFLTQPKTKHNV